MDEEKPKKKNNKVRNVVIDLTTLFVIIVIAVIAIVILGQADNSVTSQGDSLEIANLHCEKSGTDNPFFKEKVIPASGMHKLNANFNSGNLVDAMYSYDAFYEPDTDLDQVKSNLHINFDLAYGNTYVHQDGAWSESFSISEDEHLVRMSIYSKADSLSSSNAEVFMLEKDQSFPRTITAMKNAYEKAGFSCQNSR